MRPEAHDVRHHLPATPLSMEVITHGARVNESGALAPALIVLPPSEVTVVQSVVAVDIR